MSSIKGNKETCFHLVFFQLINDLVDGHKSETLLLTDEEEDYASPGFNP